VSAHARHQSLSHALSRERGILVRHFAAPLLSEGVRITVGSPEENAALVDALRAILAVPEVAAPAAG